MTSTCFVIGGSVDWIVVIADWFFDWYTSIYYLRTDHHLWFAAAVILILLPGMTVFIAQFLDRDPKKKKPWCWWGRLFLSLPCFPLMVFYLGAISLWKGDDTSGRGNRKRMIHMKTY